MKKEPHHKGMTPLEKAATFSTIIGNTFKVAYYAIKSMTTL